MSRRILVSGGILVFLLAMTGVAFGETNFSISPPPIASPTFEAGKGYMKFRGSYISVEAPGLELSGAGFDFVPRTALSDMLALDGQVGLFVLSGDMDMGGIKGDMSTMSLRLNFNLEVQPVKTDNVALIMLVGPAFDFGFSTVEYYNAFYSATETTYIDTVQYGLQVGMQLGIKAGDFHIDPFVLVSTMEGSSDISSTYGGDSSSDIDAYTTTSMGLDIEYVPWSLTLSSIVQATDDSGSSNGADVEIYQLGWRKDF